jgi:N utilization substance protein A
LLSWFVGTRDPADEVRRLLAREVPEVGSGIVQIRAIGRLPGTLTRIAGASTNSSIDAVGACVGAQGARIQSIVRQLGGERIDLIPWQADAERLFRFASAPLRIVTLSIDSPRKLASVTVDRPDPIMRLPPLEAIQFAASQLTGLQIDIRLHRAA